MAKEGEAAEVVAAHWARVPEDIRNTCRAAWERQTVNQLGKEQAYADFNGDSERLSLATAYLQLAMAAESAA